jgi:hypothetical protein
MGCLPRRSPPRAVSFKEPTSTSLRRKFTLSFYANSPQEAAQLLALLAGEPVVGRLLYVSLLHVPRERLPRDDESSAELPPAGAWLAEVGWVWLPLRGPPCGSQPSVRVSPKRFEVITDLRVR